MSFFWWYFIGINIFTFLIWGIDKWKARYGLWRISNTALLTLAALGGWVGGFVGIYFFRNKNLRPSFLWKFWFIAMLWLIIVYWIQMNS